jgi:hypothetical protein
MGRWSRAWWVGWLVASLGLHLALLQSVAWSLMFAGFMRAGDSIPAALSKTFDGQHPCRLCVWVRSKAADSARDSSPSHAAPNLPKLELATPADALEWAAPALHPVTVASAPIFWARRPHTPPVPPPRPIRFA